MKKPKTATRAENEGDVGTPAATDPGWADIDRMFAGRE
ncbi:hypothetical protein NB311A_13271 [Nitrobacter sp. Nb-311A]|nr:hypothetical protein NB311A_13271 [Nitrobacter sp. Nb-311A]